MIPTAAGQRRLNTALARIVRLFSRPLVYIQVHHNHFIGRVVGKSRVVRRDCGQLDNRRGELRDFSRIREVLRSLVKELVPGFSLRRPVGLMHFVPEYYVPRQSELEQFKSTAEKAGLSFCFLSKWETPHTDLELKVVQDAL